MQMLHTWGFKTPKTMSESCFQQKEMLMAKKRNLVLSFHVWLNLLTKDVLLGSSCLFIFGIPLNKS